MPDTSNYISITDAEKKAEKHGFDSRVRDDRLEFWKGGRLVGSTLTTTIDGVDVIARHALKRIMGVE